MSKKKKATESSAKLFLQRELAKLMKNPCSEYFKIHGLVDDNVQKWEVYIIGPPSTFYENGVFKAILEFPDDYPMKPPVMKFLSPIFHPNIYKTGKVCISTLQTGKEGVDSGQYWRPVLGIEQAILSVISLLSDPNTSDPANTAASTMYKNDKEAFVKRCREDAELSLKYIPEEFEYPVMVHDDAKGIIEDEQRQAEKEQNDGFEEEDDDDEDWEYDVEDLSGDEEDDDYQENEEEVEQENEDELLHKKDVEALDSQKESEKNLAKHAKKAFEENLELKSGQTLSTTTPEEQPKDYSNEEAPPPNTWRRQETSEEIGSNSRRKSSILKAIGKLANTMS